ncbi:hypothetical protein [Anaerotignum sp.]
MREQVKEFRIFAYTRPVADCSDLNTLKLYDRNTAHDIERLEEALKELKEHRKEIFQQAQRVAAAPVTLEIELTRERKFRENHVFYHLRRYEVREGIGKTKIAGESYPGKDRKTALLRFDQWKKEFPAATVTVDIEKRRWEK